MTRAAVADGAADGHRGPAQFCLCRHWRRGGRPDGSSGRYAGRAEISDFDIPTADGFPLSRAIDQQGRVWFTEHDAGKLLRLIPASVRENAPSEASG